MTALSRERQHKTPALHHLKANLAAPTCCGALVKEQHVLHQIGGSQEPLAPMLMPSSGQCCSSQCAPHPLCSCASPNILLSPLAEVGLPQGSSCCSRGRPQTLLPTCGAAFVKDPQALQLRLPQKLWAVPAAPGAGLREQRLPGERVCRRQSRAERPPAAAGGTASADGGADARRHSSLSAGGGWQQGGRLAHPGAGWGRSTAKC